MEWTTLITDADFLEECRQKCQGKALLSPEESLELLLRHELERESLLVLASSQNTIDFAKQIGVPVIGLEPESTTPLTGTPYIIQSIEEDSQDYFQTIYQRYYKQPVVILETERLVLREIMEPDTENLYRLYQCPDVAPWVQESVLGFSELKDFMASYCKYRYPLYDYGMWIIEDKVTGSFVGEAGIEEDSLAESKSAVILEAGYVIEPSCRNQGYASEALRAVVAYARQAKSLYNFTQVHCYIHPDNLPSIRTALNCGFIKSDSVKTYGQHNDLNRYEILL